MQEIYGDVAIHTTSKSVTSVCTLPDGYKPLYAQSKSPHHKNALHYAIKRGLTPIDIVKHQVGYCEKGPYSGMLIVPSYDENGLLNYYTGRSFYENATYKHKNPSASKDIIGFEGFVNWTEPIVIVEGAFDAIATKRNAIPLFGKKILPKLRSQILTKKVPRVYLALDPDAYKDSIEEIEYFINNNIPVYYVNLGSKDPSETGYQGMLEAIERSKEVSFFDLMQYKLGL
jgi:DNA primase